jgi:hypothetical protein
MSKRDGCRQSCCRVPFDGVCAKQLNCGCHSWRPEDVERQQRAEVIDILRGTTLARVKS